MNNIKQKNIILGFNKLTELPYKKVTNNVNQFTNIDINANFRQLVDNDLFINKKIENSINFIPGPKSYDVNKLYTAPDGYKVWTENINEGNATIFRKQNDEISTSLSSIYNKSVNVLKKVGDTIYVGSENGLCNFYNDFDIVINFENDKTVNYLYHEYDLSNIYIGTNHGIYEQKNSQYFNINSSIEDVKYITHTDHEFFASDGNTLYATNNLEEPFIKQKGTTNINPTCVFKVNYSNNDLLNDITLGYKDVYVGTKNGLYCSDIGDDLVNYTEYSFFDTDGITIINNVNAINYLKIYNVVLFATNKGVFYFDNDLNKIILLFYKNEVINDINLIDRYIYICSDNGVYECEININNLTVDNIRNSIRKKIYNGQAKSFQIINSNYKVVASNNSVYLYNIDFDEWQNIFNIDTKNENKILKLGKFILNHNTFYIVTDKKIHVYKIEAQDVNVFILDENNLLTSTNVIQVIDYINTQVFLTHDNNKLQIIDQNSNSIFDINSENNILVNNNICQYILPCTLFNDGCFCIVYKDGTKDILELIISDTNRIKIELAESNNNRAPYLVANDRFIIFCTSTDQFYALSLNNSCTLNAESLRNNFITINIQSGSIIDNIFINNNDIFVLFKYNNIHQIGKLHIDTTILTEIDNKYCYLSSINNISDIDFETKIIYTNDNIYQVTPNSNNSNILDKTLICKNTINAKYGKDIIGYGQDPDKLFLYLDNTNDLNAAFLSTKIETTEIYLSDKYDSFTDALNAGEIPDDIPEENQIEYYNTAVVEYIYKYLSANPCIYQTNILSDIIGIEQLDSQKFLVIQRSGQIYYSDISSIYTLTTHNLNNITCDNIWCDTRNFNIVRENSEDILGKHSFIFLYDNDSKILSSYTTYDNIIKSKALDGNILYYNPNNSRYCTTTNAIYDLYSNNYKTAEFSATVINYKESSTKTNVKNIKSIVQYTDSLSNNYLYGLSNNNDIIRYDLLVKDDLLSNFVNIKNLSNDFGSTETIKTFDFIKHSDTIFYYANNKLFELDLNKSTFTNRLTLNSNNIISSYFVDNNNTIWLQTTNNIINLNRQLDPDRSVYYNILSCTVDISKPICFSEFIDDNILIPKTTSNEYIYYLYENSLYRLSINNNRINNEKYIEFSTSFNNIRKLQTFYKNDFTYMNQLVFLNGNSLQYTNISPNIRFNEIQNIDKTIISYYYDKLSNNLLLITNDNKLYIYNYINNTILSTDITAQLNQINNFKSFYYDSSLLCICFVGTDSDNKIKITAFDLVINNDNISINNIITVYNTNIENNDNIQIKFNNLNAIQNNNIILLINNGIYEFTYSSNYNINTNTLINFNKQIQSCLNQNNANNIFAYADNSLSIINYSDITDIKVINDLNNIDKFIYDTNDNNILLAYGNNILSSINYSDINDILITKVYNVPSNFNLNGMSYNYIITNDGIYNKNVEQRINLIANKDDNEIIADTTYIKVYNNDYKLYTLEKDINNICYVYDESYNKNSVAFYQGNSQLLTIENIFFLNEIGNFSTSYANANNMLVQYSNENNSYIKLPVIIANPQIVFSIGNKTIVYSDDKFISYTGMSKARFFKLINSAIGNVTTVYKISDKQFIIGTYENGIYYWDNGYIYQDQVIYDGKVGCITKLLVNDIYMYCVSNNNNVYISSNLKKWTKYFSLPKNINIITDICQIDTVDWLFSTDKGIYKTKYSYKLINDYPIFTDANAIEIYNQAFPQISSEILTILKTHIEQYHSNNSIITNINNNIEAVDFNEIFNWTQINSIDDDNNIISNDIIYSTSIMDNILSGELDVYVKNFYTKNEVTKVNNASYILKSFAGGDSELYINIPTTLTYYLNHVTGVPCNIDPLQKIERINLKNISNEVKMQDSQLSTHYTECSVMLNLSSLQFDNIYTIQANGVSLPLKVYKENNNDISAQLYHSLALQTVVNDTKLISDNMLQLYIFGTDEQSIKIYGHRTYTDTVWSYTIKFNAGAGSGEMDELRCFSNKQYVLPHCTFTHTNNKFFDYWQDTFGNKYTDQQLISTPILKQNGVIELFAVWNSYVIGDDSTSFILSADFKDDANKLIQIVDGNFINKNEILINWDNSDYELPTDTYIRTTYIEGNGAIINTNHIPTLKTSIEFEMMPIDYTGENYIGFPYTLAGNNDNKDFRFFAVSSSEMYFDFTNRRIGPIGPNNINFNTNTWYHVKCYNNGMTISYTGTTTSGSATYTGITATTSPYNCPIHIFGNSITGAVNFKLKYLKIYENDVLMKHLEAAINPNNEAGFYDFTNKIWYGSINSSNMIAR